MNHVSSARYQCGQCVTTRDYTYEKEIHHQAVDNSPNGLVMYSDVHRCENGFLGINNLHIDKNNAIRSFEYLKLPSEKKLRISIPGLPAPIIKKEEINQVDVTQMLPNYEGFRLIITDSDLKIRINLGRVRNIEQPLFKVNSPLEGVTLEYYPSPEELTNNLKAWFSELISLIEQLPPTKIGLFIDTLRYIYGIRKIDPTSFHLDMLSTILTSHKILFSTHNLPDDDKVIEENLTGKYGQDATKLMLSLLSFVKRNPNITLQKYTKSHLEDISLLIYMFLTLELEGYINILRPNFGY